LTDDVFQTISSNAIFQTILARIFPVDFAQGYFLANVVQKKIQPTWDGDVFQPTSVDAIFWMMSASIF